MTPQTRSAAAPAGTTGSLDGRVAIVTGASRGIGRATATEPAGRRLRLQLRFDGVRPEDARLHALYVGEGPR